MEPPKTNSPTASKMKAMFAVPATLALVYRAWSHKSLTPAGIVAAALTAVAHAIHPWSLPFVLLIVFFLAGTRATKVWKLVGERPRQQLTSYRSNTISRQSSPSQLPGAREVKVRGHMFKVSSL